MRFVIESTRTEFYIVYIVLIKYIFNEFEYHIADKNP